MHYRFRFSAIVFAAVLSFATFASAVAEAKTLRYAMGYPPGSDAHRAGENYAKRVEERTGGELKVKVYPLSLLNFAETSAGLRDGLADIGYLLNGYFPAEYPHSNLLAEAAMQTLLLGDDVRGVEGPAYIGALAEYVFFKCPECHEEFTKQNQVFTGVGSSSPYVLNCNKPVTSTASLRGKRLRAAGSQWSRWAQAFGATPVTLSGNEAFEALNQGIVDCVIISLPDLVNLGVIDATTDITPELPGGVYAAASVTTLNTTAWQSFSDKQREALLWAAAHMSAEIPWVYHERQDDILERAQTEKGIKVHQADAEFVQATRDFVVKDLEVITQYYERNHGVKRGPEMLQEFQPILEKWVGLVQNISSKEELGELYWSEVFSKVDPSRHGM